MIEIFYHLEKVNQTENLKESKIANSLQVSPRLFEPFMLFVRILGICHDLSNRDPFQFSQGSISPFVTHLISVCVFVQRNNRAQ